MLKSMWLSKGLVHILILGDRFITKQKNKRLELEQNLSRVVCPARCRYGRGNLMIPPAPSKLPFQISARWLKWWPSETSSDCCVMFLQVISKACLPCLSRAGSEGSRNMYIEGQIRIFFFNEKTKLEDFIGSVLLEGFQSLGLRVEVA